MLRLEPAAGRHKEAISNIVRLVMIEHGLDPDADETGKELDHLPESYREAGGEFFVILDPRGRLAGTLGIKYVDKLRCELTRMYLLLAYRGKGEGGRILRSAMDIARSMGFRSMELETAPAFRAAIQLYGDNGFEPVAPLDGAGQCSLRFRLSL